MSFVLERYIIWNVGRVKLKAITVFYKKRKVFLKNSIVSWNTVGKSVEQKNIKQTNPITPAAVSVTCEWI
jgi:hypothetical protein